MQGAEGADPTAEEPPEQDRRQQQRDAEVEARGADVIEVARGEHGGEGDEGVGLEEDGDGVPLDPRRGHEVEAGYEEGYEYGLEDDPKVGDPHASISR